MFDAGMPAPVKRLRGKITAADGKLADDTTRKFLTELLAGFKDWIVRMQKK